MSEIDLYTPQLWKRMLILSAIAWTALAWIWTSPGVADSKTGQGRWTIRTYGDGGVLREFEGDGRWVFDQGLLTFWTTRDKNGVSKYIAIHGNFTIEER